jgi:hypothetical protein
MEANVEKNTTLNHIEGKIVSIPVIDKTLTKSDRSADAKVVGEEIARLDGRLDDIDPHFAENVQYDNASSGLSATNVQGAVDMITKYEAIATNYVSEVPILIPKCSEIWCEITNSQNKAIVLSIPYITINGKTREYNVGGYIASTAYMGAKVCFENNQVYFKDAYVNGSYDSTTRMTVYCKGVI